MSYGYDSVAALMSSVFPSTKYVSIGQSVALSSVWGVICSVLGIWPILALAMIFVMVIELVSGVTASHKRMEHFESSKFSRFVSCQMFSYFAAQYGHNTLQWMVGAWFFDVLTVILMMAFVVEHTTSILENMACIDGREKSYYIDVVKRVAATAIDRITHSPSRRS